MPSDLEARLAELRRLNPGVPDEVLLRAEMAEAASQSQAMEGGPAERLLTSAARGIGHFLPIVGPAMRGDMGGVAADTALTALPFVAGAMAAFPPTAPLAPFVAATGPALKGARAASAGLRLAQAASRAGVAGAVAGGAEAAFGDPEQALSRGVTTAAGTAILEPVMRFLGRVLLGTAGARRVISADVKNMGEVINRDIVVRRVGPRGQVVEESVFGPIESASDLAEIAIGDRGIGALRRAFEQGENAIRQRLAQATGQPDPEIFVPALYRDPQTGLSIPVKLSQALNDVKELGAKAFRRPSDDAAGFQARQQVREAQQEIANAIAGLDPAAGFEYEQLRSMFSKGIELIGLLNERNVFQPGGKGLNMAALQQAVMDNLRFLEQKGLAQTARLHGQKVLPKGTLGGEIFRGGGLLDRDVDLSSPIISLFLRSRFPTGGGARVDPRIPLTSISTFAGEPFVTLASRIPSASAPLAAQRVYERLPNVRRVRREREAKPFNPPRVTGGGRELR